MHHQFMKAYGYVPIEEFRKIKIATFYNLLDKINRDIEQSNKMYESMGKSNKRRVGK